MPTMTERSLFIPIILGTTRRGRQSENVARFVFQTRKRADVETELIDVCKLPMKLDDAGEQMKDPEILSDHRPLRRPHYCNSRIQSWLSRPSEARIGYESGGIHSQGRWDLRRLSGLFGGVRAIEALLPVMRELGLVTTFWDVNFGNVEKLFDDQGNLLDQSYVRRLDKFLNELIWMARVLRYGRENIPEVKTE